MRKILFPTDFSDAAKNALQYTLKFANEYGCSINLFHAYRQFAATTAPVVIVPKVDNKGQLAKSYMDAYITNTKKLASDLNLEVPLEYELVLGLASDEVVEKSKEEEYDLIAMGKTGESSFTDQFLGSVTTATIKRAHCPVLAIPENSEYMGIDKILYATDETGIDKAILKEVIEFAERFRASIYFVHVDTKLEDESILEDKLFEEIFSLDREPPVPFEIRTISGNTVVEALNDFVEANEIDLTIMVKKHRNFWNNIFARSATRQMTFHSKVPLLVLHSGDNIDL